MLLKEEEKLPELSDEIRNFIKPKIQNKNKKKLLGDYPDKIIIFPQNAAKFLKSNIPIKTIVISLENPINILTTNKLKEKSDIILSIPAVLYEKEAKKMQGYIMYLNKNGFNHFEANSYTGMQILKNIDCNKYLGLDMPVMNHLSAEYFYNLGYLSVYATIEGDKSIYKSLNISTDIQCLIFGKIPLFQSRVNSKLFCDRASFKDKFDIQIECFKQKEINIFVSKTYFYLIGKIIKQENIFFDSLTADLRYFNNPLKTLQMIFDDKFDNKNLSTFNFFRKLI